MSLSLKPYTYRRTHSVSSNTVLAIQTCSRWNSLAARAPCAASSCVIRRTKTLVSTATMPLLHRRANRLLHLAQGLWLSLIWQASDDVFKASRRKQPQRSKQQAVLRLFDGEFGSGAPFVRVAQCFWQDNLAFGTELCDVHGYLPPGKILVRFSHTRPRPFPS